MNRVLLIVILNHVLESKFTDLGRLRVQECERVVALRTELTKCGAKVVEEGDTLTVYPQNSTARRLKPTTTIAWRCVSQFWD
jgi:5-enolpyruvylshikimate-3-phosphate synthase